MAVDLTTQRPLLHEHPFVKALGERTGLFDGAMGTPLYERGVFMTQCFEQQNLVRPRLVRSARPSRFSPSLPSTARSSIPRLAFRLRSFRPTAASDSPCAGIGSNSIPPNWSVFARK